MSKINKALNVVFIVLAIVLAITPFFIQEDSEKLIMKIYNVSTYLIQGTILIMASIFQFYQSKILNKREVHKFFSIILLLLGLSFFCFSLEILFPIIGSFSTSFDWILVSYIIFISYKTGFQLINKEST